MILNRSVLRALAGLVFCLALPLNPIRSEAQRDTSAREGAIGQGEAPASRLSRVRELSPPLAAPTATPSGSPNENVLVDEPPFRLPFDGAPGPSSWLLIQVYGNTTFAYRERIRIYDAGQGLHFGIDLGARCGTPVLAIGEGVVVRVDDIYHGAGPHNVVIDHPNGYASLYGHLLARSPLEVGQSVQGGELVGLSGDPDLTCSSRPHLHLEIRNAPSHRRAFNPMPLIEADWDRIALAGAEPIGFEQNLAKPSQWITWQDQPEVIFGQPLLNEYESAWPPDW